MVFTRSDLENKDGSNKFGLLWTIYNILVKYGKSYKNFVFIRDFNVTMDGKFMTDFCELNDLSNIIDKSTCYRNFDKLSWIDLILTNKPCYCQYSFRDWPFQFSFADSNKIQNGVSKT